MHPRVPAIAVALSVLTCFAAARSLAQAPPLSIFVSKHYEIHTNLTRLETIPFGRHVDAVYEAYDQRFIGFSRRSLGPMPLYLFRTQAQYDTFLKTNDIHAEHSGGVFFIKHGLRGLATWVQDRGPSQTLSVLQHEGFHQFAWAHLGPGLPTWVNEGLAQYFEDAVVLERRMHVGLADVRRIETIHRAVAGGRCLPVAELMTMTAIEWADTLRDSPQRAATLYAQSWSIVYFLIHGNDGRYRAAFEAYLQHLGNGYSPEVAFRRAFGSRNALGLERRWLAYAATMEPDPVNVAVERMAFLAAALGYLAERREAMPDRLDRLRDNLQARRFTVTRSSQGQRVETRADDETLYTYDHPNGYAVDFLLLESPGSPGSRSDRLPPRITAPGLDPEPTLVWFRSDHGELGYSIKFR